MDPKADCATAMEVPVSGRLFAQLPESVRRFVLSQPKAAESAVRAALEGAAAAATQRDLTDSTTPKRSPRERLQDRPVEVPREEQGLLGVTGAAAELGVDHKSVYNWIAKRRLLAWRTSKQGYSIPKEQILGRERIVEGIPELLEVISNPELAWAYLSWPWPFEDAVGRPIEKLRAGEIDDVLDAAPGFGSSPA